MGNKKYIATFEDMDEKKKIRITLEQKRLLDWLYGNDYLLDWATEWNGNLDIEEEDYGIIDLTI